MSDLNLIVGTVFDLMRRTFELYTDTWLLTGFLMLWLFRRVAKLFQRL